MAAPHSLAGQSCGPAIAMMMKTTATAVKVMGVIGSGGRAPVRCSCRYGVGAASSRASATIRSCG